MTTLAAIFGVMLALLQPHAHAQRCDDVRQQWRRHNSYERLAWQAAVDADRNGDEAGGARWRRIRDGQGARVDELLPLAISCGIVPSTTPARKTPPLR